MRTWKINHIFLGLLANLTIFFGRFIRQPGRYPKTSGCQIDHLRNFWSSVLIWISIFSLMRCYRNGHGGWLLSETKFINFWCTSKYLRNGTFMQCRGRISLAGQTFLYTQFGLRLIFFLCINESLVSCSFSGIFPKIWSKPSIIEVYIIRCTALWSVFHNICPIWVNFALPREWDHGELIINHHM